MTTVICALIAPIVGRAQSVPNPATLAKYDKNRNGRLDPDEIAAMQSDQDKYAKGLIPDPFQYVVDVAPFPSHESHFFEKIDGLDTRPWRYAKIDNIEVLSRCSDVTTMRFVTEFRHRLQLMKPVRPERPIASLDFPLRLFLIQQEKAKNNPNAIPVLVGGKEAITLIVNLGSDESSAKTRADDTSLLLAADDAPHLFVSRQLWGEERYWLSNGLHHFYLEMRFAPDSISFTSLSLSSDSGLKEAFAEGGSRPKIDLLPMEAIFNEIPDALSDKHRTGIWWLQRALFIRWALLGDHQRHKDEFWKFAARARSEPITERLFKECFGMRYAKMQTELGSYMQEGRAAIRLPLIAGSLISAATQLELGDATVVEIERFKASVNETIDQLPNL